jgi:hypothetical protein
MGKSRNELPAMWRQVQRLRQRVYDLECLLHNELDERIAKAVAKGKDSGRQAAIDAASTQKDQGNG